ncbi:hypothetical protein NEFER03_0536 [Nematocida sp. LUAm3]|nr:hypothetical protein NEFER03_0536 [Nematocida sp. LUAm3]KAI5175503.1 hypothetical protein NEFER02_1409 [Nematocida sp. LUAm2]KAI5178467.1 hypothetical protein NEFER01_1614 [Nematocida sp. LUAm1]
MENYKILEYLRNVFPLKGQVATGLVGNILGFLYTMMYISTSPYISLFFSYAFTLTLYLIYLYVKELVYSSDLDILIFFLAINVRVLKSLTSHGDNIRRTPEKKKKKEGEPLTRRLLVHPEISNKTIPFERILEEFTYRIVVLSCVFCLVFQKTAWCWRTFVVLGGAILSFFLREFEYSLMKKYPPGYLTREMYGHYADLIKIILFLRI